MLTMKATLIRYIVTHKDSTDRFSQEVLKVRDALDATGHAETYFEEVAEMYRKNRNPYHTFKVSSGPRYSIDLID